MPKKEKSGRGLHADAAVQLSLHPAETKPASITKENIVAAAKLDAYKATTEARKRGDESVSVDELTAILDYLCLEDAEVLKYLA